MNTDDLDFVRSQLESERTTRAYYERSLVAARASRDRWRRTAIVVAILNFLLLVTR